MKKILLLLLLVFISMISFSWTDNDCKKYFKGKWKYKNISKDSIYVMRTLEKQIEYNTKGKYYYEFKIKWLNNCKYQLTYLGTNSPHPAVIKIGESLSVEILNIGQTQMIYKTIFRDLQETDEMEKIE